MSGRLIRSILLAIAVVMTAGIGYADSGSLEEAVWVGLGGLVVYLSILIAAGGSLRDPI